MPQQQCCRAGNTVQLVHSSSTCLARLLHFIGGALQLAGQPLHIIPHKDGEAEKRDGSRGEGGKGLPGGREQRERRQVGRHIASRQAMKIQLCHRYASNLEILGAVGHWLAAGAAGGKRRAGGREAQQQRRQRRHTCCRSSWTSGRAAWPQSAASLSRQTGRWRSSRTAWPRRSARSWTWR